MTKEANLAAIEQVIKNWDSALYDKDIERLAEYYSEDCTTFDVGAQVKGPEAIKSLWEPCLQFFGDHIGIQRKNESLIVSEELALFTSYNRLTGMASDMDAAKSWLRATVVLRKLEGEWKIIHEHISFPFECDKEKPAYILD